MDANEIELFKGFIDEYFLYLVFLIISKYERIQVALLGLEYLLQLFRLAHSHISSWQSDTLPEQFTHLSVGFSKDQIKVWLLSLELYTFLSTKRRFFTKAVLWLNLTCSSISFMLNTGEWLCTTTFSPKLCNYYSKLAFVNDPESIPQEYKYLTF